MVEPAGGGADGRGPRRSCDYRVDAGRPGPETRLSHLRDSGELGTRVGDLFLLLSGTDWPLDYPHLDPLFWLGDTLSAGRRDLVFLVRTPLFRPGDWSAALGTLGVWRDRHAPAWRLGATFNLEAALGLTPEPLDADTRTRLVAFQARGRGDMLLRRGNPRAVSRPLRLGAVPGGPFPFRVPLETVAKRIGNQQDGHVDPQYVVEDVGGLLRLLPLAAGRPKLHGSLRRMAVTSREWLQLRGRKPELLADVPLLPVPGP